MLEPVCMNGKQNCKHNSAAMPTRQHFLTFQNFQLWTLKPCGDTDNAYLAQIRREVSCAVAHNKQANACIRPAGASACADPGGTRGQQPQQAAGCPRTL